ncbi:MAG: hypothetical protein Kow0029_32080 [Candidatus Rifleibacteriota bacterium]
MENVISTFDLEVIAKKHDIRIWLCRKIGRRWAYIIGAGEQRPLPSELIFELDDYGFFVQGDSFIPEAVVEELKSKIAEKKQTIG